MDTIVARIEFAFAHVPRPGNGELGRPGSNADLSALDAVEDWHELTDDAIESAPGALEELTPDAFRHYLPAYMRWICNHVDEEPNAEAVLATFRALAPDGRETSHVTTNFSLLGAEQSACIAAFFERVAQHPAAQDARAYWRMRAGYLPRD
jgi:hypothetical protein